MNLSLPIPDLEEKTDEEIATNKPWKVIVLNDPVNLMNYVVMVFRKVFGYDETKATKHMMEVHELGKSVLSEVGQVVNGSLITLINLVNYCAIIFFYLTFIIDR